jgi:hypothetical protein
VKINSLWFLDLIVKFTDRGTPFSEPDPGDLLEGSLTAQHLVAPHTGDDPKGDTWSTTLGLQDATNIFIFKGGAQQMTVQLHDPNGDIKNHPSIGHTDTYSNGSLIFNVVKGDDPNEGHISTIQARLTADHTPEPSSIVVLCSGLLCLALLTRRRATMPSGGGRI